MRRRRLEAGLLPGAALALLLTLLGGSCVERTTAFVLPHEVDILHKGIVLGMPVMKPKRAPVSLHLSSAGDQAAGGFNQSVDQERPDTTNRTYTHAFDYTFESGTRAHFSYQVRLPLFSVKPTRCSPERRH
jgi:hypothetical protein